ncbi:hypothetical protein DFH09DRAFT_1353822 [Mycena vulgaris]|nr:hypothetical protein DFH09DRAFT_1353822 [Mycena vulgaris]
MPGTQARRPKPYPWPWGQPSILTPIVEEKSNSWLGTDLEDDDASDSDYVVSEGSESSEETSDSASISDAELADISEDAAAGWPSNITPFQKAVEEREDLPRQIAELVQAEQASAAAYSPDAVVALVTELYELLVTMGHWTEGSLKHPPHTATPVNPALAAQLGYTPSVISLMQKLPYVNGEAYWYGEAYIIPRTRLADYTLEADLREGRHPYPYQYLDGCPDLDPWLLPLALPNRDGWNVMLDTNLGSIRAYNTEGQPPQDTVEWKRHGEVADGELDRAMWTDYRRAPLVPAVQYLSEVIYAYRSLARLPLIDANRSDPACALDYPPNYPDWIVREEQEQQDGLLTLYRECGWPDEWRRAEFVAKWEAKRKEIAARTRRRMDMQGDDN